MPSIGRLEKAAKKFVSKQAKKGVNLTCERFSAKGDILFTPYILFTYWPEELTFEDHIKVFKWLANDVYGANRFNLGGSSIKYMKGRSIQLIKEFRGH